MRTIALLLALAAAVSADPIVLRIKLAKGKSWKVDQTVALKSDAGGSKQHSNGAVVSTGSKTPFVLTEKWTDACVAEADGRPEQIRRTMTMSRIATGKVPQSATKQEGAVFLLARSEKKCTAKVEKGKPEELSVKILQRAPAELLELMLPDHDVSEGDEWEIGTLLVMDIQLVAAAGVAGAQGPARSALEEDIEDMDSEGKPFGAGSASSGATIVKAKLKSVKDKVATIEFVGDLDVEKLTGGKEIPGMPKGTTKVTGSLTLNVETGQPMKLEWKQQHVQEPMQTPTGEIPGMMEEWTLTRAYSK